MRAKTVKLGPRFGFLPGFLAMPAVWTGSTPDAIAVIGERLATDHEHNELLSTLLKCRGKVVLSGYSSPLYKEMLADWYRRCFKVPNQAAGGKRKRIMTEVVWTSFECSFDAPLLRG
jgi:hypothetical protein